MCCVCGWVLFICLAALPCLVAAILLWLFHIPLNLLSLPPITQNIQPTAYYIKHPDNMKDS